jgi:hypothetical protein
MQKIGIIALFLMFGSWPLMSDPIQMKKHIVIEKLKEQKIDPRVLDQRKRVDLSLVAVNKIDAWKSDLSVPTTSNDGIEIIPAPAS